MRKNFFVLTAVLGALLGGCNKSAEPDIGVAPVAQLQGVWMFSNRAIGCSKMAATFGGAGFFENFIDNKPRHKIFDITQYAVGGGIVLMDIANWEVEPAPLKMTLAVGKGSLKMTELSTMDGVSYKAPPAHVPAPQAERMKNIFRIAQLHFTMAHCPDGDA